MTGALGAREAAPVPVLRRKFFFHDYLSIIFQKYFSYAPGGHHALGFEDLVSAAGAALAPLHPLLLVRYRGVKVNQGPGLLILTRPENDNDYVMRCCSKRTRDVVKYSQQYACNIEKILQCFCLCYFPFLPVFIHNDVMIMMVVMMMIMM